MQHHPRVLVAAAVLLIGIVGLNISSSEAADQKADEEFKRLIDADAKNVIAILEKVDKKQLLEKRAAMAIAANAMMIAHAANSRIDGKNAADDARFAGLRDRALKVAVDARGKKFKAMAPEAKLLDPDINAAGTPGKAMAMAALVKGGSVKEIMYQFNKTVVGGLGLEDQIRSFGDNKVKPTAAQAAEFAARATTVAEFCEAMEPEIGFAGKPAANTKEAWLDFNKKTREKARDLVALFQDKKADPRKISAAFTNLDGSCVACHNVFRK